MDMVLMLIAHGMDAWSSELQAKDVRNVTERAIAMKCRMRELDNKRHGAMFRLRFRPALKAEIEKRSNNNEETSDDRSHSCPSRCCTVSR